ncbi:hypothetical protein FHS92_000302 [Sphingobium subterraneum]|uniref:Uncharacterized protein n=1 Tax=Sphingobium subterraneum TaxID=627688 RepID=A0A841J1R9_9SPHN|nr:hypothetical protein [Sphingobium subterraneum]
MSARIRWTLGVAALGLALPVVAQKSPTSLLPPGFGEPDSSPAPQTEPTPSSPRPASTTPGATPNLRLDMSAITGAPAPATNAAGESEDDEELTPEELAEQQAKYDLPETARRSLDRIGPLTPATGGIPANGFGRQSGQFLATLMRVSRAPFVSRWGSILLRRVLLSQTDTPGDIGGAEWAAERAWLLVRMGEADAARLVVQSVDNDQFTPRLYAVAMQTYLASADPTGLCPLYERAAADSTSPSWQMAHAMCASFSADQGTASALLNEAQRRGRVTGIDYRLTEKVVGAGANSRRSVKIEWDGVDQLTAWRYGLATAMNVDIPPALMNSAGSHVRAWQASAPMLSLPTRLPAVEAAARLGVFSSSALVDFYSQLAADESAPDEFRDRSDALRAAYAGGTIGDRVEAMRKLWGGSGEAAHFVGLLATARAAAALPVADADPADVNALVAAMLSAGYDNNAANWSRAVAAGQDDATADGWAMLAVGAPRLVVDITPGRAGNYAEGRGVKGQFLIAGLAGLARIGGAEAAQLAADNGFSLQPRSLWERAIDAAAQRGEPGTVALLAAIGMQVTDWRRMPAEHLYHIVSALHRVGLDPEARMIAAEAIMRT